MTGLTAAAAATHAPGRVELVRELTLVVPPSCFSSLTPMMSARGWIERVVGSEAQRDYDLGRHGACGHT